MFMPKVRLFYSLLYDMWKLNQSSDNPTLCVIMWVYLAGIYLFPNLSLNYYLQVLRKFEFITTYEAGLGQM
jgi:hypothetical protein